MIVVGYCCIVVGYCWFAAFAINVANGWAWAYSYEII